MSTCARKPSGVLASLAFLIVLVISKGDAIVVRALINRDALLNDRHVSQLDCSWALNREMMFGQRALDAKVFPLAKSYLDRIFSMSGRVPCPSASAHLNERQYTDDKWGRFVVYENELTGRELSIWLSMWAWANKWRLVNSVAKASVERYPDQLFGYYYLAQAWLHTDNTKAALDIYLSAMELFPDSALLCREIARLYQHRLGDTDQALHWYQESLELDAAEPTALLGVGQLMGGALEGLTDDLVRQLEASGWTYPRTKWTEGIFARGYTLDEDLYVLSHGVDIELYVFWDGSQQDIQPLSGWFRMGEWWIARERTQNLAPNPRFVWDQTTGEAMMPQGYRDLSWEGTALTDHALVDDQRDGQAIVCAQLLNRIWEATGFFTMPILVHPDTCYLQAGWIKTSDGGNAYIGYQWQGESVGKPNYGYVASKVQVLDWTHYTGVAIPLPGSQSVRLRLLNNLSNGVACFNDVMFVPVACR